MKRIVTTYDMMISSPSDTKEEIEAVFESVADFNRHSEPAMIRILRWNKDVFMNSSKSPQESINEQIVEKCDFAVAIFKQRLGMKVGEDISGTAQEIRLFREKNKQVFVFCWEESLRYSGDGSKKTDLQEYIESLKEENVWVREYTNPDNLRSEVLNQLKKLDLLQNVPDLKKADTLKIHTIDLGQSDGEKMNEKIENARHVKIFQTTGNNFFRNHVDQLSTMLRNGGTLQVLLPNPESEFLHDVDLVEGRKANNLISKEFSQTIGFIGEIWEKATMNPCDAIGKIWIGCARTMLRQTETICIEKVNKNSKDDMQIWCWVTMTMPPKRASAKSLSFESETSIKGDTSLANLANINFDRSWEEAEKMNLVFEFTGQYLPYFYKEKPHAIKFWRELTDTAKNSISKAQKNPKRDGVLIEVAAQHPLKSDGTPDEEFCRRLDMGFELYHRIKQEGKRCKIYVPGSLHMYEGIVDRVSLSEAGKEYLLKKEILGEKMSAEDIYGESENSRYRGDDGVYNSADECFVASQIWKNDGFSELFCVCSPVQCMRKTAHYIAFGIFPSVFTCPSPEMFHNYVGEMFEALPYVLYEDPYFQPGESKRAIEQRKERKPGFAETWEKSSKAKK